MNIFGRIKLLLELQSGLSKLEKAWNNYRKAVDMGTSLSITQVLKSKTVWTAVGGAALNIWQQLQGDPNLHISPEIMSVVNVGILLLTSWFRKANTAQTK